MDVGEHGETLRSLGRRVRALRVLRELQQREVAARAGVSPGTVIRLERTGRASLDSALRIAFVLGAEAGFDRLFEAPPYRSLDEALARPTRPERLRVRRRR
ncbi:MAG TPA: helix-turn-helix transcriptional regulator [Kofleriaceae bacterium]|nr:helix-turn-helix transcriptional regulator [Kofleriaceae bacterium]